MNDRYISDKQEINQMILKMLDEGISPLEVLDILEKDKKVNKQALDEWFESFNKYRATK